MLSEAPPAHKMGYRMSRLSVATLTTCRSCILVSRPTWVSVITSCHASSCNLLAVQVAQGQYSDWLSVKLVCYFQKVLDNTYVHNMGSRTRVYIWVCNVCIWSPSWKCKRHVAMYVWSNTGQVHVQTTRIICNMMDFP